MDYCISPAFEWRRCDAILSYIILVFVLGRIDAPAKYSHKLRFFLEILLH
jgi:hypothetical protein